MRTIIYSANFAPVTKKEIEKLIAAWKKRPYSWSQHSSFDYDKDQWFLSYVLGVKGDPSPAMLFGNVVGQSLATNKPMADVPRQPHMEYEIKVKLDDFSVLGYFDSYNCGRCDICSDMKQLEEYKTSGNTNKWNQKSVDTHGQLTYYCMLLYLRDKVKPEDVAIRLHYIPVEEDASFEMAVVGKPQSFNTKRTMTDVLRLMVEIKKRRKEMERYARKRLEEYDPKETLI